MDSECKSELNLTLKCPLCKVMYLDSHEYQMEGFVYTCVILSLYLFLTTIFMVKIICLKRDDRVNFDDEQKRKDTNEMCKNFREREKQKAVNSVFEIHTRKQFKKQMIGYLNSMKNIPDINFNRSDSPDDSTTVMTDNTSIVTRSKTNDYLKIEANEQSTQTTPKKAVVVEEESFVKIQQSCQWKIENEQQGDDNDYGTEFYL